MAIEAQSWLTGAALSTFDYTLGSMPFASEVDGTLQSFLSALSATWDELNSCLRGLQVEGDVQAGLEEAWPSGSAEHVCYNMGKISVRNCGQGSRLEGADT